MLSWLVCRIASGLWISGHPTRGFRNGLGWWNIRFMGRCLRPTRTEARQVPSPAPGTCVQSSTASILGHNIGLLRMDQPVAGSGESCMVPVMVRFKSSMSIGGENASPWRPRTRWLCSAVNNAAGPRIEPFGNFLAFHGENGHGPLQR